MEDAQNGVKSTERELDKKTGVFDITADAADGADGAGNSRSTSRRSIARSRSLVLSSETSQNPIASGPRRKLRSQLVSSDSESSISLDSSKKLKRRVWFSPDVPDVHECSKDYRLRRIAIIARRMRDASTPQRTPSEIKETFVSRYRCSLCDKDCIRKVIY